MKQFMLMIRPEKTDFSKFSQSDFQNFMAEYGTWSEKLIESKEFVSGEKLSEDLGKTLRKKGTSVVIDGPYADSKDAVSGFYIIRAKSESEAVKIAKGCPAIKYGGSVEVREVEELAE